MLALEMNSGRRILLDRSSLLVFCDLGNGTLSTNTDFDLGMGDWMSDSDNEDVLFDDDLLFGKENERERAVALSLDRLLQNASALVSSYPAKRKRHLQTPVTVLQLLWQANS